MSVALKQTEMASYLMRKPRQLHPLTSSNNSVLDLATAITVQVLWQHPFESIRATGDDGGRFLWIDFGPPSGEQELDLITSAKPIVFILHSFLATKVYRLGLYA